MWFVRNPSRNYRIKPDLLRKSSPNSIIEPYIVAIHVESRLGTTQKSWGHDQCGLVPRWTLVRVWSNRYLARSTILVFAFCDGTMRRRFHFICNINYLAAHPRARKAKGKKKSNQVGTSSPSPPLLFFLSFLVVVAIEVGSSRSFSSPILSFRSIFLV